jgi:hypothetical protein
MGVRCSTHGGTRKMHTWFWLNQPDCKRPFGWTRYVSILHSLYFVACYKQSTGRHGIVSLSMKLWKIEGFQEVFFPPTVLKMMHCLRVQDNSQYIETE